MKAPLQILFIITFFASFFHARSESDSCTSNLKLKAPIPFDTTNLHCLSVWDAQGFILRYVQTSANIWSFILSTPDTNSYIAIGFSATGGMVGSSAIVGWVASRGASGGIKQYYLGGVTPNQVVPDKGNLQVIGNSTFITLQSSRVYMVFQLETTEQPFSWLILATGSTGIFPAAPSYALTKHLDKVSTRIDYSKANVGSSQVDGNSSQANGSSSSQAADSCNSKLNLSVPLLFDTTKLNCLPVWNTQGYILRYSQTSSNIWSFILSAPNPNSYIAMGFSPKGGMVGSSAIVGWISSNGSIGGMKQYYLAGYAPNQVIQDRGNLQVISNSTLITSQSSRLYMAFQLQTNQPLTRLVYAIGPNGFFPSSPSFALVHHQDKVSITVNYATGSSASQNNPYMNLKRSHGVLNILGWGIFIIMGAIVARHFKQWDPFWFYFHASVQSLGFVLGVYGVISGLVLNNQLHLDVNLHKIIGIIILVLACLQYGKASSNVWSFILSFPSNIRSYAAIGFSKDGNMVGSTAFVGWMPSPGAVGMKMYSLSGMSTEKVIPDKGDLYYMNASINSAGSNSNSLLYMVFQLKTNQPIPNLLFAIGPKGVFPQYPHYALAKHSDAISLVIDYSKGTRESSHQNLRRSHGILSAVGWSIIMIIGSMVARYFKQWGPNWFYLYASIQIFGFLAGVIGIICGITLAKKLDSDVPHHKIIAILIIILGFLQVLAIKLRPGPESKIRKYWNWYHHNVGRILICFTVCNTIYGLHLGGEGPKWFLAYGVTILILVIIIAILEMRKWIIVSKENESKKSASFPQTNVELGY